MTTAKKLFEPIVLTTSAVALYTTPNNTSCVIKKLTFTNYSVSTVTVTVNLVPAAGSATDTNVIRKTKSLATLETWEAFEVENHVLSANDMIQALCSANTSVNCQASGVEIT